MFQLDNEDLYNKQLITGRRKVGVLHYHEKKYELYFLLSGTISYLVNGEYYFMKPGDLMILPPQLSHSTDSQDCIHNERILISFEENNFEDSVKPYLDDLCNEYIITLKSERLPRVDELCERIRKEYETKPPHYEQMLRLYISELILYLHRHKHKTPKTVSETKTHVQQLSQYIFNHYNEDLSLETLSKELNISGFYLSRKFKAETGISFNQYINYVRVSKAKELLKAPFSSITEVAYASGFNDSNYFTTVFKKHTGMTPLKFSKIPTAPFEKKGPISE